MHARQLVAQRVHPRGEHRRVRLGVERRRVIAARRRGQGRDREHRFREHVGVTSRELVHDDLDLVFLSRQAGVSRLDLGELARIGARVVQGMTGVGPLGDPRGRPTIETLAQQLATASDVWRIEGRESTLETLVIQIVELSGDLLTLLDRRTQPGQQHEREPQAQTQSGAHRQPSLACGRALERAQQLVHVGPALRGLARETPAEHSEELAVMGRRLWLIRSQRLGPCGKARVRKRLLAPQRLVERHAKRELIAVWADALAEDLLERHVLSSTEQRTGGRQRLHRAALRGVDVDPRRRRLVATHETKVGDLWLAGSVDQHVLGLEVAMHEPDAVRGREPPPDGQE